MVASDLQAPLGPNLNHPRLSRKSRLKIEDCDAIDANSLFLILLSKHRPQAKTSSDDDGEEKKRLLVASEEEAMPSSSGSASQEKGLSEAAPVAAVRLHRGSSFRRRGSNETAQPSSAAEDRPRPASRKTRASSASRNRLNASPAAAGAAAAASARHNLSSVTVASPSPRLPRRFSFREPAETKKTLNQERRGSLKAFASSLLDRTGSFNRRTPTPHRGSIDSAISSLTKPERPKRQLPTLGLPLGDQANVFEYSTSQPVSPTQKTVDLLHGISKASSTSKRGGSLRLPTGRNKGQVLPSDLVSALSDDLKAKLNSSEFVTASASPSSPRVKAKMTKPKTSSKMRGLGRYSADSGLEIDSTSSLDISIKQVDFDREYDIVQLIGEGWFSRVYLTEHRETREELVLKAINSKTVNAEEFLREYHYARLLSSHHNVLSVYEDVVFQTPSFYYFATEYAPLGDLTSNVSGDGRGIGELCTKKVAKQISSALEWVHSKDLCHLDVKLDNILVFKSDFSWVKLCDFGAVRQQGDIVKKKNELLPYCPPELVALHTNDNYQVDKMQDVFQFGVVTFFCLFGILPWQRADVTDPNYSEFFSWRSKKTSKPPKNFKPMNSRAQKLFRKLMDVEPSKRIALSEVSKYIDDKWLKKSSKMTPSSSETKWLSDGVSQLTMGSFQSVHSNAVEKNRVLFTLLQHGVETTVDRSQKNSRIINWIQHGQTTDSSGDSGHQPQSLPFEDEEDAAAGGEVPLQAEALKRE